MATFSGDLALSQCRARIYYKIRKHYSTRFGRFCVLSTNHRESIYFAIKYFLKAENSEYSLASSCEEFCIDFRVTQYETGLQLELARGCSGDLHYDRPRNLPSNPPELLCICIVRVYTESYVDSQNSLFCLLTCNNDHKSLYMPILWYVIISPNSI